MTADPATSRSPEAHLRVDRSVVSLVERALDLPESERSAFLATSTGIDPESRVLAGRLLTECEAVEREESQQNAVAGGGGAAPRVLGLNLADMLAALPVESADLPRSRRLAADSALGPFRITRFVAAGGMGEVYEAVDMRVGRRIALKTLPLFSGSERGERFAREAMLMARLEHPAIARLYEWGTAAAGDGGGRIPYIAMEFVEGRPLREALATMRAEAVRPSRIVEFMLPAVDAVAHAHARGVLHRDIKPSNILVDGSGTPRLLDFGVAALIDDGSNGALTLTEAAAPGTLTYMSPEQVRGGARRVTTQSDVYSLGLLLHEAIRGLPVVDPAGRGIAELIEEVLQRPAPRLFPGVGGVSPDLDFVIRKALAKDQAFRYRSADALGEDLRRVLRGETPLGRDVGALEILRRLAWRQRRSIAVGAAVAVALATVAGFGAAQFIRAREAEARAEVFVGQLLEGSKPILTDLHVRLLAENQPLAARKAALEATVAYLEWVQANAQDDARVLAEVARRYRALATVAGSTGEASLGDSAVASQYYLRSLALLDGLLSRAEGPGGSRAIGVELRSQLHIDRSNVLRDYAGQLERGERAAYFDRAALDQRVALALMPDGAEKDRIERFLLFTEVQAARLAEDEAALEAPLARMRAMATEPRFATKADFLSELGLAEYFAMQGFELAGGLDEVLACARASKAALERSIALGQDDFTNNRHLARVDLVIVSHTAAERRPAESLELLLAAISRSRHATNLKPDGSFHRISHLEAIVQFAGAARLLAVHARDAGDAEGARTVVARAIAAVDEDFAFTQALPTEGALHRGEPKLRAEVTAARDALAGTLDAAR